MAGFNPRWIVGKTVARVAMNPFSAGGEGRGETAHDPRIYFTDGSSIAFTTEETEVECRKDRRCELADRHVGPCARYVEHDSMCGCGICASKFENGGFQRTFELRLLNPPAGDRS